MTPPREGPVVENLPFESVPPDLRREIILLTHLVWPLKEPVEQRIQSFQKEKDPNTDVTSSVVWHILRVDGVLCAMSRSFRRVVATESGRRFPVLALASVCVHPGFRQHGYGRSVVAAAWARLNREIPVSFYQTGVPGFYERMGARLVSNSIYDSTGADCAFWEPHAMIYPADAPWPDEPIDLLGRGW